MTRPPRRLATHASGWPTALFLTDARDFAHYAIVYMVRAPLHP